MWSINKHIAKVIMCHIERPDHHILWLSLHLEVGQHDKYGSMGFRGKASSRVRGAESLVGERAKPLRCNTF